MHRVESLTGKVGLPPGTLVHVGAKDGKSCRIKYMEFSPDYFNEIDGTSIADIPAETREGSVVWINVDGLQDVETIRSIGERFNIHQLLLEDVLNTYHRPKFDEFEDQVFMTLKMIGLSEDASSIVKEHVSIIHGDGWVISFQEMSGDLFEPLRQRLRDNVGIVRTRKAGYYFYRLADLIVDNYYYVTEHLDEQLDELEAEVTSDPDKEARISIQRIKSAVTDFRKSVFPLREAVFQSIRSEHDLMQEIADIYLKDLNDHLTYILETVDSQREQTANILDLYLSGISFKMNQVMQVLTIIATIFIPLTFIAGIYGMNFAYMPELQWKYGYFYVLGGMGLVLIGMIIYFRNKKWL